MTREANEKLIQIIADSALPITEQANRYDHLLQLIGDARFVLIGEATHGTREFYQERMAITKALIEQKQFMAVTIEGDWPDAYQIHRYLQGAGDKTDALSSLKQFTRFPTWMWRNKTLPPFLSWLRDHNDALATDRKIGFYGLDLYSLNASMQAVIDYLKTVDPVAAERARERYACFDHAKSDPQQYGYLINLGIKKPCIKEAVDQLLEMQHHAFNYIKGDHSSKSDDYFFATQNARVVKDAEHYYRSMFEGHVSSWNVRDTHMMDTLNTLADHLENKFGRPAKIIVWAHNSHVGDARATEMGSQGEINIGQLVKEQHASDAFSIGFSTYDGTVTAASDWGAPSERKVINEGIDSSYEELFHHTEIPKFILPLRGNATLEHYLQIPRLQRAIGVIYRPDTERMSHYFFTRLPYQFDCVIHIDRTAAIEPLNVG